jgi:hypothetical protein
LKKIISLFKRDYSGEPRLVYNEVVPGAEWVEDGEGIATEKFDGTAALIKNGKIYKRYDRKPGREAPEGWEPCEEKPDEVTGHWPGWVPVDPTNPNDKYFYEAADNIEEVIWYRRVAQIDGTYELVGPKINKNPYRLEKHFFWKHGSEEIKDAPRDFDGLKQFFINRNSIEGIVWHHPDGRMVKIKRRDFGLPWPII